MIARDRKSKLKEQVSVDRGSSWDFTEDERLLQKMEKEGLDISSLGKHSDINITHFFDQRCPIGY